MLAIVRKEWRAIVRDGRFAVLALSLGLLLAGLLAASAQQHQRLAEEKAEVAALVREQWDDQGDKHPHRGAHFGLYALRPDSPLAGIDPGLDPYLGQALWLEPHRRNMTRFRPAADEPPSVRFGQPTPAFALVVLLPLLIIALAFHAVSQERESGTLRMLHSAGLRGGSLLVGKLVALLAVVALVLLLAVGGGLGLAAAGTLPPADALWRGLLLALAYLLYCGVFAALALAVSAWTRTSRLSLFVLLGLWVAFVFAVPRLGAAAAQRAVPLPTAERFWGDIHRDYTQGLPGDADLATRGKAFEAELLRRHQAQRLEDLPFGVAAARRLARDAYADRVHALHFDALWQRQHRQEQWLRATALLSPAVAMRAISMKMAGTDLAHQRHFEEAAEGYRRQVNTRIDQWDVDNTRGITSFDDRYANNDLWRSVEAFRYAPPRVGFALRAAWPDLLVLLAWALASAGLLRASLRKLDP
ncbi:ABC transporter permease subunit [Hydrogenophaga sp.]|uniref:ABC transporter permease subunit n=1 Tax=Hydrogenophaga sp. TaxID=1904254 RepID=UPI00260AF288|nr:ABC transporter permease subunit [Hydrogenophaga sp.]